MADVIAQGGGAMMAIPTNFVGDIAKFGRVSYYSPPRCKQRSASSEAAGDGSKKGACFKGAFLLPGSGGGFVLGCVSEDGVVEQLFADWDVSEVDLEISQTSLQKSA